LEKAQQNSTSHGFRFKNPLYSVDATTIDLCLKLFPWADFRENKGGINNLALKGGILNPFDTNKTHGETGSSGEDTMFCGRVPREGA
jgi:hypothetical protein